MASTHDPLRAKAMGNAPALPDRVAKAAYPVPLLSSQVSHTITAQVTISEPTSDKPGRRNAWV